MTTPYSTPRYPVGPNPTPRSTGKLPRAPIHNPYDKFTQPEFDAWIGDITGALKRALGREDAPPALLPKGHVDKPSPEDEDAEIEDSFAEVRARRVAKGKERAREEDFDDAGDVSQQVGMAAWDTRSDEEDYGSEDEDEEDDEEEQAPETREAEVIDLLSSDEDEDEEAAPVGDAAGEHEEEDEEDEDAEGSGEEATAGHIPVYDDEDDEGHEAGSDEEVAERVYDDEDDDQSEEADEDPRSSPLGPSIPHEVTEILDSDDEETKEDQKDNEGRIIPARFLRKADLVDAAHFRVAADEAEDEDEQMEEEADSFPPRSGVQESVDLPDPWEGPRTYAEDYYAGGDLPSDTLEHRNPHVLPTEEEDELLHEDALQHSPEIPDPWEGPRTYAEDYYSGGDAILEDLDLDASPSHLTPQDENEQDIPGVTEGHQEGTLAGGIATDVDEPNEDVGDDVQALGDGVCEDNLPEGASDMAPSFSATLRQVDWNWPPAFSGRIATASGHLVSEDREMIEISDDEDEPGPYTPTTRADVIEAGMDEGAAATTSESADAASYIDFDLYDMGPSEIDTESTFEPVRITGADFGDLPPSRGEVVQGVEDDFDAPKTTEMNSTTMDNDIEDAPAESASDVTAGNAPPSEISVQATAEKTDPIVEEARNDSLNLGHAIVEEGLDVDDIQPIAAEADLEVVSVPDDDVEESATDYVVEEPKTEGRRTEEPESIAVGAIDETVEEQESEHTAPHAEDPALSIHADSNASHASATLAEPLVTEAIDETCEALPTAVQESAPDIHVDTDVGSTTDYPAPVSADPTVPDPASIASTPASPIARSRSDSIASSSGDVNESKVVNLAHAALLPLLRKVAPSQSPSGLFTPLTDGATNSGSVTPELPASQLRTNGDAGSIANNELDAVSPELPVIEVSEVTEDAYENVKEADTVDEVTGPVNEQTAPPGPLTIGPTESEDGLVSVNDEPTAETSQAEPDHASESDADADAEGEVDPDYVPSEGEGENSSSVSVDDIVRNTTPADDDDPFRIHEPPVPEAEIEKEKNGIAPRGLPSPAASENATDSPEPLEEGEDADTQTEPAGSQETVVLDESHDEDRPRKRKRRTPPAIEPTTRFLRSRTSKSSESKAVEDKPPPKSRKGKGKQRARPDSDDEDAASVVRSVASGASTSSSAAAAQQLLDVDSRPSSRESSVVSNVPSTYSDPSPTIMRTLITNGHHLPPPAFTHDHGVLRHNHGGGRPIVTNVPAPVVHPKRQPSKPPSNHSDTSEKVLSLRASVEPPALQPPQPTREQSLQPPALRPSISIPSSSPVTRANCRYHTISLPQEENGQRLFFAVPGCSLGNRELMEEESIEDHGDVSGEDISRLVPIEHLNLPPYLLGILRQLAGVDLLREQEVLYLPRPGDNVRVKKSKRRTHAPRESISAAQRESISARTLSKARQKDASLKQKSSMPPPSQASSISTSGRSASHGGKLSERGSITTTTSAFSGSDLSDIEDDEDKRPAKRVKNSHPETSSEATIEVPAGLEGESSQVPAENGEASTSASTTRRRMPARRGKKLGTDAAAYKPERDESDGSDEAVPEGPKRKRTRKGGVKRTRAEETADAQAEGAAERPKRRRVRGSTSKANGEPTQAS